MEGGWEERWRKPVWNANDRTFTDEHLMYSLSSAAPLETYQDNLIKFLMLLIKYS